MSKPVELTVISGKGGTGKTVLASSLAALLDDKVMADCDVDAPDLHLLLRPTVRHREIFLGKQQARIDTATCVNCGRCLEVCRFGAVKPEAGAGNGDGTFRIDDLACEGCGVCAWTCPVGAIRLLDRPGGEWFVSDTRFGTLVHACLGVAQENSGQLVTVVREHARRTAQEGGYKYVVIDGPPGIGCPVIASIAGTDLAVVVTEPTLSGVHDLERVVGLTGHFGIRTGIVVNKYDLNDEVYREIEEFTRRHHISLLGRIAFDTAVNRAIAANKVVVEFSGNAVTREIRLIADRIVALLDERDKQGAALKPGEG
jgi:MinD superfamily P-loop ATPase